MAHFWRNRRAREAALAILAALCVAFFVTGYAQSTRVTALSAQIIATYQKALFEAGELMGGAQINLEKLMIARDDAYAQTLLGDIARQTEAAQDDLAILPDQDEATLRFINQAGDLAKTLGKKLAAGGALTAEDRSNLAALRTGCVALNETLARRAGEIERGEATFNLSAADVAAYQRRGDAETEPLVSYPVLLYDGPFSDASDTAPARNLGAPVDAETAGARLKAYVGEARVLSMAYTGTSQILGNCFEYAVETASGTLRAAVTELGGEVLYILPEDVPGEATLTRAACTELAAQYLAARGYDAMTYSYGRQAGNVFTVNFAASQDGVLLYPDLVKLQVSMADGQIVGVDAGNYLRNHVRRTLDPPVLDEAAARARIWEGLAVAGARLCVIPVDQREALCWEIAAQPADGGAYLVYIDAMTGAQRMILQVVEDGEGVVTQ